MAGLNDKQLAFCRAYVADPARSSTQAAITAGYSPLSAARQGVALVANPLVQKKIAALGGEAVQGAAPEVTAEWVVSEIALVAKDDTAKVGDRLKALELLGKYLSLFTERRELDVNMPVVFVGEGELRQ